MLNQFIAIGYLIVLLLLGIFLLYRLRIGKTEETGGSGFIYAGLILIFLSTLINLLQQQAGYPEWFLTGTYSYIAVAKFLSLIVGMILLVAGLALYFSYWSERDREVANHLAKLKLLDSLQQESRYPFPMGELLERALRTLMAGLEEEAGAIFLLNRAQRQFVLTSSAGLTREEVSLLEYYPYGRNIVTQSIEDETPLISADFRSLGGKAQLAASRFHSILVIPLVSGKNKLGAILFFSQDERRYSREYISVIAPVADWLTEKVEATRLGRELGKAQRELEIRASRLEEFSKKLENIIERTGELPTPAVFARRCLGMAGADEVWLLGLVDGYLRIHGGTAEKPDFSDSFKTALVNAIPRNKAVILNQEGTDQSGNSYIARSSLLLPADNHSNVLLLRNNEGPSNYTGDDLKVLEIAASVAAMVISHAGTESISDSRRRGLDLIGRVWKLKLTSPQLEKELKPFLEEMPAILPPDSILLLYRRQEEQLKVAICSQSDLSLEELSISPGEGSTGRVAVTRGGEPSLGAAAVAENLSCYDEEIRNVFKLLFGDRPAPVFQADYPIVIGDRADYVMTVFCFQGTPAENTERHRLISVLVALMNLKIEITLVGRPAGEIAPESVFGSLTPLQINELNNELAAISGYCQMARRDPNLPGETSNLLGSILKTTEEMAVKIREFFSAPGVGKELIDKSVDINHSIRESFRQGHISDNLYMIGGRPFEVNLNLKENLALGFDPGDFISFLDIACRTFTENVAQDEIITISTYMQKEHVYIDISRHRKNFPPVEQVSGFGRYMPTGEIEGPLKQHDFLGKLAAFSGEFAYDKYSQIPSYFSFRFKREISGTGAAVTPETMTILAVDDQVVILELLAALCQSMGYKIITARNGREGLDLFETRRPDLVIADLAMPGMSGMELASRIKSLSSSTPVILITGWGVSVDADRMSKAGIDHILHKPFRLEQLADLISKVKISGVKG